MGVKGFQKTGLVGEKELSCPDGHNLLWNTLGKYTESNPYVISGTRTDIWTGIGQVIKLPTNLGNTFYLLCKSSNEWSPQHNGSTSQNKVTIWYYLKKDVNNTNNQRYDSPVCYTSSNWVSKGVWRTTIDVSTYKSMNIRVNTYSDGSTKVTAKFWDFKLIPAKYFLGDTKKSAIYSGLLSSDNFIEY